MALVSLQVISAVNAIGRNVNLRLFLMIDVTILRTVQVGPRMEMVDGRREATLAIVISREGPSTVVLPAVRGDVHVSPTFVVGALNGQVDEEEHAWGVGGITLIVAFGLVIRHPPIVK